MLDVKVKSQIADLDKTFAALGKESPRAIAKTITILAASGAKELRTTLGDYFTLRNKWTAGGMQYVGATPSSLESFVGTTRDYLVDHVDGAVRDQHLAVPQVGPGRPRTGKLTTTPPSKFPGALKRKARRHLFVGPTSTGSLGLWGEFGSKKSPTIRLLYVFPKQVTVKADWDMPGIVWNRARERFSSAVHESMEKWRRLCKV